MKSIIVLASIALIFSGCSRMTPSVAATVAQLYDTTKTIRVLTEEVVITNADLLPENVIKELDKINENFKRVDAIKEIIVK